MALRHTLSLVYSELADLSLLRRGVSMAAARASLEGERRATMVFAAHEVALATLVSDVHSRSAPRLCCLNTWVGPHRLVVQTTVFDLDEAAYSRSGYLVDSEVIDLVHRCCHGEGIVVTSGVTSARVDTLRM